MLRSSAVKETREAEVCLPPPKQPLRSREALGRQKHCPDPVWRAVYNSKASVIAPSGSLEPDLVWQRNTSVGYIKNMDFSYRLNANGGRYDDFTVTAVAGHLMSQDFSDEYRKWQSCDPFQLFDAPIVSVVGEVRLLTTRTLSLEILPDITPCSE